MPRKRPGPKGTLPNPTPVELQDSDDDENYVRTGTIGPDERDGAERELRAFYRKHRDQLSLRPKETVDVALSRIRILVADVLNECGVAWWSDRSEWDEIENPDAFRP